MSGENDSEDEIFQTLLRMLPRRREWKQFYGNQPTPLQMEQARGLIQQIDVAARNGKGQTPLHVVIDRGNYELAVTLIEKGADVNAIDNKRQTPFHMAGTIILEEDQVRWLDSIPMFSLLIERGANINAQDNNGNTPLHHAAKIDMFEDVEFLIKNEADENIKNNNGRKPMVFTQFGDQDQMTPPGRAFMVGYDRKKIMEGKNCHNYDDYSSSNFLLKNYRKIKMCLLHYGTLKCPLLTEEEGIQIHYTIDNYERINKIYRDLRDETNRMRMMSATIGNINHKNSYDGFINSLDPELRDDMMQTMKLEIEDMPFIDYDPNVVNNSHYSPNKTEADKAILAIVGDDYLVTEDDDQNDPKVIQKRARLRNWINELRGPDNKASSASSASSKGAGKIIKSRGRSLLNNKSVSRRRNKTRKSRKSKSRKSKSRTRR